MLAITGLQFHDLIDTFTQQDVELDKLFMDACIYNARIMGAAHVTNVLNLAVRTALDRKGPAHLTMPVDMQSEPAKKDPRSERNVAHHLSTARPKALSPADDADLDRAAAILNSGKNVCILAGRGALDAGPELAEAAERLAAPVAKALLGKAALPDMHPNATGGVGLLGTVPSQKALAGCDTLLIVGSSFPYIEFYPEPGKARAVQIDADPARLGLRYPIEVGLAGDARATLAALMPRLQDRGDTTFLNEIQVAIADWRKNLEQQGTSTDRPMKPQVVAYELNRLLADDTIITTDSGTNTSWAARFLDIRGRMMFSVSGNLASMACGLPYANAAALAFPERPVVALVGDGGLSMLMSELATTAKYNLNVKVVVIKNNSLGQIKWEQLAFLGNPEYGCELQPIDFAAVARACGIRGFAVDQAERCADVLAEAFAAPGPALIEATVDPNEPPLPPKATLKQGRNILSALLHGTKDAPAIAEHLAAGTVRQLV